MPEDTRSLLAKTIDAAGITDTGKIRSHNEDSLLVRKDLRLFVVADGAGGHNAGNIASMLAVKSIENYFDATQPASVDSPERDRFGLMTQGRRLASAIQKANSDVMEISKASDERRGMGTTVVAVYLRPEWNRLYLAHVGDSRCYRLRAGHLESLTHDHTMGNDIMELRPGLEDAVLRRLPCNVVTRALGMGDRVRVELREHHIAAGDRYLLCSDGLYREVPEDSISLILRSRDSCETIARRLVDAGNSARGADNLTALVIDCFHREKAVRRDARSAFLMECQTTPFAAEIVRHGVESDGSVKQDGAIEIVPCGEEDGDLRQALEEFAAPLRPDWSPEQLGADASDLSQSVQCSMCYDEIPGGARYCPFCGKAR